MHRIFELTLEIIGWIQIVLSPLLFGLITGFLVYINMAAPYGLIIGILLAGIGLVIGIILATKKFKTTGTMHFLSQVSGTPELDPENSVTEEKDPTT